VAVKPDELAEGLEFRLASDTDAQGNRVVTLTALLKPDVSRMIAALDSDAEAQFEATERFYRLLRVHLGTRGWLWSPVREPTICAVASDWIKELRGRPVLLDRITPNAGHRTQ
jgi:hypothetical protein